MNKWVNEIVEVLEKSGGSASLKEIYLMIEIRNNLPLNDYKDWRSVVRKNIYKHSSECDIYTGEKEIFQSIEGKGMGKWKLHL
jgi:5-methylcytosine-specific restriction enzyme A